MNTNNSGVTKTGSESGTLKRCGLVLITAVMTAWATQASARATLTTLHTFSGGKGGGRPMSPLLQGADGAFYGTTLDGGASGEGTLYKVTSNSSFTLLHSFAGGTDGFQPTSELIQGSDGNLYGTTHTGGINNKGTVYEMNPVTGEVRTLYSFAGVDVQTGVDSGSFPEGGLVQAGDGNFYGTTCGACGSDTAVGGPGVIFKITPGGVYSVIYTFSGPDGLWPMAGLTVGADGALYGSTSAGGATYIGSGNGDGEGSIFKIMLDGSFTSLYSFSGGDGDFPAARLTLGSSGLFYGSTLQGGATHWGTVFSITPQGVLHTLVTLASGAAVNMGSPSGVIEAADGNLYGTAAAYLNSAVYGGVFKIAPSTGQFTPVFAFNGTNGSAPAGGVIQGSDGNFYGTTSGGGRRGWGTVFKLAVPAKASHP